MLCASASVAMGSYGKDFKSTIKVAGGILLAAMTLMLASPLFELVAGMSEKSYLNTYFGILIKAVGISFLTYVLSSVCRDCGETSIAGYAEFAGKVEILIIAIPLIEDILEIAEELVEKI